MVVEQGKSVQEKKKGGRSRSKGSPTTRRFSLGRGLRGESPREPDSTWVRPAGGERSQILVFPFHVSMLLERRPSRVWVVLSKALNSTHNLSVPTTVPAGGLSHVSGFLIAP